jgi:hypothetical protein
MHQRLLINAAHHQPTKSIDQPTQPDLPTDQDGPQLPVHYVAPVKPDFRAGH